MLVIANDVSANRKPKSGAPVAQRTAKRNPPTHREIKETHELIFSCYGGKWYFSWARTHDDGGDGGVAQHDSQTPDNIFVLLFWFLSA